MVKVTRLDGSQHVVNALFIEFMEETPDTVISLSNGKKIIVKEPISEIIDMTIDYLNSIGSYSLGMVVSKLMADRQVEAGED